MKPSKHYAYLLFFNKLQSESTFDTRSPVQKRSSRNYFIHQSKINTHEIYSNQVYNVRSHLKLIRRQNVINNFITTGYMDL